MNEFEHKSLSSRMREAADTLEEATNRYFSDGRDGRGITVDPELHDWRPANLRYVADQFDEEDDERWLLLGAAREPRVHKGRSSAGSRVRTSLPEVGTSL